MTPVPRRRSTSDWSYQSGRDPAYEAGSIGWVLTLHAIRESVQDGMRAYRFLLGQESYKTRFTIDDHGLDSFVIPRTARGHAGHFATRARGRLARWAGRG